MQGARVLIGEETIARSVDFYTRAEYNELNPPIGMASCARTETRWRPEFALLPLRFALSRTEFREPAWSRRKREEAAAREAAKAATE